MKYLAVRLTLKAIRHWVKVSPTGLWELRPCGKRQECHWPEKALLTGSPRQTDPECSSDWGGEGRGFPPPKQGPTTTKVECALRWDCRFEANDNDYDQGSVENPELLILITKNSSTITQPQTSHIGTCYLSWQGTQQCFCMNLWHMSLGATLFCCHLSDIFLGLGFGSTHCWTV